MGGRSSERIGCGVGSDLEIKRAESMRLERNRQMFKGRRVEQGKVLTRIQRIDERGWSMCKLSRDDVVTRNCASPP